MRHGAPKYHGRRATQDSRPNNVSPTSPKSRLLITVFWQDASLHRMFESCLQTLTADTYKRSLHPTLFLHSCLLPCQANLAEAALAAALATVDATGVSPSLEVDVKAGSACFPCRTPRHCKSSTRISESQSRANPATPIRRTAAVLRAPPMVPLSCHRILGEET